jgi:ABC-type Fe3+/spermidine/putrescine transport system ATPase subunit
VFPPQNTVGEILGYRLDHVYDDATRILEGITKMMNLIPHLDSKVVTLSSGEKRKLALARALIMQPMVMLLDEPLNNLDIISKGELRDEIQAIHRYLDLTTIHVTHDQLEALTMADKVAVIRSGELRAIGTVEEVYNDPRDEYAARFFGYRNIYDVHEYHPCTPYTKVDLGSVTLRTSHVPDIDQKKVAVHGAEIMLHKKTPVNTHDNLFQGQVTKITTMGPTSYITADIGEIIVLTMGRRPLQDTNLVIGDQIWVQFSPEAVKPIRT